MANNKIHILTLSGCLTKEAISAWRGGTATRAEMYIIKKHLDECPFCKEALEGYSLIAPQQIQSNLNQIRDQFNKSISKEEKQTKISSKKLLLSSAAAIILLILGIYGIFKFSPSQSSATVAQNIETNTEQKPDTKGNSGQTMNERAPALAKETTSKELRIETDIPSAAEIIEPEAESPAPMRMETDPDIAMDEAVFAEAAPTEKENSPKEEAAGYSSQEMREKKAERAAKPSLSKTAPAADAVIITEEPAKFQNGSVDKFKLYVEEELALAIKEKKASPGKTTVSFIVDTKGKIKNIILIKGMDEKTNSVITEIIQNSPKWIPAQQNDKVVESSQIVTFTGK